MKKIFKFLIPADIKNYLKRVYTSRGRFSSVFENVDCDLVCVDVGASYFPHGNWWLPINLKFTKWLAIDPIRENLGYFNNWKFKSNPKVVVTAVGKKTEKSCLYVTPIDSGSSVLKPQLNQDLAHRLAPHEYYFPYTEKIIATRKLTDILDEVEFSSESVAFLKIDTQGSELDILKGASALLDSKRIVLIEVESSFQVNTFYEGAAKFWMVCEYLESKGFELIGQKLVPFLGNGERANPQNSNMVLNEADGIFVLRRSIYEDLDVKKRCAILIAYITYNYLYEALSMLESDCELNDFLRAYQIDVADLKRLIGRSL